MSTATEKPSSKGGGDLTHRHRVEKGSKQLDIEKNPCIKVMSSATDLNFTFSHRNYEVSLILIIVMLVSLFVLLLTLFTFI